MSEELLRRYDAELKTKIAQKMIPNKTEDQILLQHFKYHDLEGLGFCNLRNFIKTHERLGVVLPKIKDIESIFNYYDKDGDGRINYKQFCQDRFKPASKPSQPVSPSVKYYSPLSHLSTNIPHHLSFIDALNKQLLSKGGAIALMRLAKEIQIVDYNNSNKITIDDFIKVLRECNISLNQNDYLSLFGNYDLFINGILFYNEILKQLIILYWNDNREIFTNELFGKIQGKIGIKELNVLLPQYKEFIDNFKFVCKSYAENSPLSILEFKNFVKYFSYGIENDDELYEKLLPLEKLIPQEESRNRNNNNYNENSTTKYKPSKSHKHFYHKAKSPDIQKGISIDDNKKGNYSYRQLPKELSPPKKKIEMNTERKQDKNIQMNAIEKLLHALSKVNRRTLFSFIKHFRYYENDFQSVTKYDFLKILKDYHIELPLKDVEKLFFERSHDIQKTTIHHEKLFKELISHTMNDTKLQIIKSIFDHIQTISDDYNNDELTIEFIKRLYSSKNNILNNDENNCKLEFDECIELFHFGYKGLKGFRCTKEEFIEFYSFISLLLNDDNDFIELIENEFRPQYIENNNNNANTNQDIKHNRQELISTLPIESNLPQQERTYESRTLPLRNANKQIEDNDILNIIEDKLKQRGIRGLIYLHNQFVTMCPDLDKISFDDFVNVLHAQHILMNMEDYETIYNQFKRKNQTFDAFKFIRVFKKELNKNKLKIVEKVFDLLDENKKEQIDIDTVLLKFTGDNHPEVIEGRKNCEEIIMEFYDTFKLNHLLLASEDFVNFEIFANYYEYVAFVYSNDELFCDVAKSNFEI